MPFIIKFKDKGFSLLQILLIAGALAGGALVMTKVMTEQKTAQKSTEVSNDLETIHSLIETALMDGENCTETIQYTSPPLINKTIAANLLVNFEVPHILIKNSDGDSTTLVRRGEEATDKRMTRNFIKIMNMNIRLIQLDSAVPGSVAFDIEYSKQQVRGSGGKDVKKLIPITLTTNDSGQITGCFAGDNSQVVNVAQSICNNFGSMFLWNSSTLRCDFIGIENLPSEAEYLVGYNENGSPQSAVLPSITFNPASVDCNFDTATTTMLNLKQSDAKVSQIDIECEETPK